MDKIRMRISSTQTIQGEEPQKIEFVTEGKHYLKNGAHYLVYDESEISGMEGCTTTLKLMEHQIKMKRYGDAKSELVFEKGQRHSSDYITPYGHFKLEVLTQKMEWALDDNIKGNIFIKYSIAMQAVMESENVLKIEVM